jgi:hypothetical protein
MTKVIVYSAIYGGYERPKRLPANLGVPAVLYTDDPQLDAPGWDVRVVTDHLAPDFRSPDPLATLAMMRHKWWKCHPRRALPDADVSIWLDAQLEIIVPSFVGKCLAALGDDDWTTVTHPNRDCAYAEADFSGRLARYDAATLDVQCTRYRAIGYPARHGLFATGASVRRHTPVVESVSTQWWDECVFSHQDQVSLPVLFWTNPALRWNENMPWWQWWTIHPHGH